MLALLLTMAKSNTLLPRVQSESIPELGYVCYSSGSSCDLYADMKNMAIAGPGNLSTVLNEVEAEQLIIMFRNAPTGEGEDKIDLGAMRPHTSVSLGALGVSSPVPIEAGPCSTVLFGLLGISLGDFEIVGTIRVRSLSYILAEAVNAQNLKALTGLTALAYLDSLQPPYPQWKILEFHCSNVIDQYEDTPKLVQFTDDGWVIGSRAVAREIVPETGKLAIVRTTTVDRPAWEIELEAKGTNIRGINLTNTLVFPDPGSVHQVRINFTGDWSAVTSNPVFVFQSPEASDIVFVNAVPSTIRIRKKVYTPYDNWTGIECEGAPEGWDPETEGEWGTNEDEDEEDGENSGNEGKGSGGGLGTGVIVAIVIGAIVLVGAIGGIAYWAVTSKKQPVAADRKPSAASTAAPNAQH
jgi:hypothetical protein